MFPTFNNLLSGDFDDDPRFLESGVGAVLLLGLRRLAGFRLASLNLLIPLDADEVYDLVPRVAAYSRLPGRDEQLHDEQQPERNARAHGNGDGQS